MWSWFHRRRYLPHVHIVTQSKHNFFSSGLSNLVARNKVTISQELAPLILGEEKISGWYARAAKISENPGKYGLNWTLSLPSLLAAGANERYFFLGQNWEFWKLVKIINLGRILARKGGEVQQLWRTKLSRDEMVTRVQLAPSPIPSLLILSLASPPLWKEGWG